MDWNAAYEEFHKYLHLNNFPIGYALLERREDVPASIKWVGHKINICQQTALARFYGWPHASRPKDQICVLGAACVGMIAVPERVSKGEINCGVYQHDLPTAESMQDYLPKVDKRYEALVTFPLSKVPEGVEPMGVIIYGNSAQMMRLIQADLWSSGGEFRMASSGDAGLCSRGIAQIVNTGQPTLEIPCVGDRRFAATQDTEIIFAFPAGRTEKILKGLAATYRTGSRYPVPPQMDEAHMPKGFFVVEGDLAE